MTEEELRIAQEAARKERDEIVKLIDWRIETANGFINGCHDHGLEPSQNLMGGLIELQALRRDLMGRK